jgi:hypothetical protein
VTTAEDPPADELVVKVDVRRAADPAAHVAAVLRRVAPEATAEEVFPGLRTGASAGLVTVRFTGASDVAARRACLTALTDDPAVASVHAPKSRYPR